VVYNVADLVVPIPNFAPSADSGISGQLDRAMSRNGYGGNNPMGAPAPSVSRGGEPKPAPRGTNAQINPAVMAQMPGAGSMSSGRREHRHHRRPGGLGALPRPTSTA